MATKKKKKAKTRTKPDLSHIAPDLRKLAVPIGKPVEDPANVRLHDEKNIDAIASSLDRFGQTKPIVVRKGSGIVVAGNGTLVAARSLGWNRIAVSTIEMTDAEATAYAIVDNRTSDLSTFDDAALAAALETLGDASVGLGFSDDEMEELLDRLARDIGTGKEPEPVTGEPAATPGDAVHFTFGDVRGIVERDVYLDWLRTYNERRETLPTLSEVINEMVRDLNA
jgi:hypothetical protein